jgi:hypothetical protein
MEPISLLAAGAATLFAAKVVQEAGSQAATGLSAAAERPVACRRGKGREDAETAAAMPMVAAPTDQARIDLLAKMLAARANVDPSAGEGENWSVAPRRRGRCD